MKILFYCPWSSKKKWLQRIKLKFKEHRIYTLQDKFNFRDIESAIIWNLPNEIFSKLINLKLIFSLGAGTDHILNLSDYKNTPIIRIKDLNMAKRMSNHVHSQILNFQLKLNYYQKAQKNKIWLEEIETFHNKDFTVGILGAGFLGTAIGKYLQRLNYEVIGYKSSVYESNISFPIFTKRKINNFIKESDILVSILPLTPKTNNFIDQSFLKKMKKNALLINVGRGELLNEEHLIEHLKINKNFFASLDVFKNEPLTKKHNFWNHPNITITPHIAAISDVESSVTYMYQRFLSYKKNGKIISDVNLKKGY